MDKVIELLVKHWHEPRSMLIALAVVAIALISVFGDVSVQQLSPLKVIAIVIVLAVLSYLWYSYVRIPKTKKGKIGFVIALNAEDDGQRKIVQSDLIKELKLVLESTSRVVDFDIIVLPKWHSEQIQDMDAAAKYIAACGAHLLMYGDTRMRRVQGKNQFVFRLRQVVLHKTIPVKVSHNLAQDFSSIFPSKLSIDEDVQLEGMEIASNWMGEAAKYFIAMAAMVSGDFKFAEDLLINVKNSKFLPKIKSQKGVARIRTRALQRLAEIYSILSNRMIELWSIEHSDEYMDELNEILIKMKSINRQNDYVWKLRKAIWYFVKNNDVENALRLVQSCRGESDATWRYSMAFLYAFEGDLNKSIQAYRRAFTKPASKGIAVEVETFISWAIEEYPNKYQLYFCLGFINYKLKEDYVAAKRDFDKFISSENSELDYAEQFRLSKIYLNEMEGAASEE